MTSGALEPRRFDPNDYENIEAIGRGAYGTVTKQRRKSTASIDVPLYVAVKNIVIDNSGQRYSREYKILQACNHQNILKMFHWEIVKVINDFDHLLLYTEFCDYNLMTYFKFHNKNLRKNIFQYLCFGMIQGCAYLHSKRIVHRDIKPENILINVQNDQEKITVKIADFGLARPISQTPNSSLQLTTVGTKKYSSPEIVNAFNQGETVITPSNPYATDIFSLGVVIFELFTKRLPFTIKDLGMLSFDVEQVIRENVSDPMMLTTLNLMLQYDPSLRPEAKSLSQFFGLLVTPEKNVLTAKNFYVADILAIMIKEQANVVEALTKEKEDILEEKEWKVVMLTKQVQLKSPKPRRRRKLKWKKNAKLELREDKLLLLQNGIRNCNDSGLEERNKNLTEEKNSDIEVIKESPSPQRVEKVVKELGKPIRVTFHVLVSPDFNYDYEAGDRIGIIFGMPISPVWTKISLHLTLRHSSKFVTENNLVYLTGDYFMHPDFIGIDIPYLYALYSSGEVYSEFIYTSPETSDFATRCINVPINSRDLHKFDDVMCIPPHGDKEDIYRNWPQNKVCEFRELATISMSCKALDTYMLSGSEICKTLQSMKEITRSHCLNGMIVLHCGKESTFLNVDGYNRKEISRKLFSIFLKEFGIHGLEGDFALAMFLCLFAMKTDISLLSKEILLLIFNALKGMCLQVLQTEVLAKFVSQGSHLLISTAVVNAVNRYFELLENDILIIKNAQQQGKTCNLRHYSAAWVYAFPIILKEQRLQMCSKIKIIKWKNIAWRYCKVVVNIQPLLDCVPQLEEHIGQYPVLTQIVIKILSDSDFKTLLFEYPNRMDMTKFRFDALFEKFVDVWTSRTDLNDSQVKHGCKIILSTLRRFGIEDDEKIRTIINTMSIRTLRQFPSMVIGSILDVLVSQNSPSFRDLYVDVLKVLQGNLRQLALSNSIDTYDKIVRQTQGVHAKAFELSLDDFKDRVSREYATTCLTVYIDNAQNLQEEMADYLFKWGYNRLNEKSFAERMTNIIFNGTGNMWDAIDIFLRNSCLLYGGVFEVIMKLTETDAHKNIFQLAQVMNLKELSNRTERIRKEIVSLLSYITERLISNSMTVENFKKISTKKRWERLGALFITFSSICEDSFLAYPMENWMQETQKKVKSFTHQRDIMVAFLKYVNRIRRTMSKWWPPPRGKPVTLADIKSHEEALQLSREHMEVIHWFIGSTKSSSILIQLFESAVSKIDESATEITDNTDLTAEAVVGKITDARAKIEGVLNELADSSIKINKAQTFFQNVQERNELTLEISALQSICGSPIICEKVSHQVSTLFQLTKYDKIARVIRNVFKFLQIRSEFQAVEIILEASENQQSFKDAPLSIITEDIISSIALLREWQDDEIVCLSQIEESESLVTWMKNNRVDLQKLKVFVEKNSISKNKLDAEIDQIMTFQAAKNGYAPLIFDLKSDCSFVEFVHACQALFINFRADKRLPIYLRESNLILPWIQMVVDRNNT